MRSVALISSSQLVLRVLQRQLAAVPGLSVCAALEDSGPIGPGLVVAEPDVILVDGLPADCAVATVQRAAASVPGALVVVLTSSREAGWVEALLDAGAGILLARNLDPAAIGVLVGQFATGAIIHSGSVRRGREAEQNVRLSDLTARELEILRFVAAGRRNQQIADALTVTPQTVKFHLTNIYRKLNVSSRTEASRYAHVTGLVDEHAALA